MDSFKFLAVILILFFGAKSFSSQFDPYRIELDFFSGVKDNDRVENLAEVPNILYTLKDIESRNLLEVSLDQKPWSDSYWPLSKGLVGDRYADPGFPKTSNWSTNYSYISSNPAPNLIANGTTDMLAPSEKYDYLVGDTNYTLTRQSWGYANGKPVEYWAGICDGWAQASIFYKEPLHAVTVHGNQGQAIKFYPSDIKGLGSLLWAKAHAPVRFIGSRCGKSNPPRDSNGRVIAQECFDNNPAAWHLSAVNQIGQARHPFIINATYDYEIWNYPVWQYSYTYFNPQTLQPTKFWRDSVIPIEQYHNDKFKKYRDAGTRYVAGINMALTYMVELEPTHLEGAHASSKTVNYVYDLELDSQMKIIGGEWYSKIHPDFIWTPKQGSRPLSISDSGIIDHGDWTGDNSLPASWAQAAPSASQQLQPLAAVVEKLVQLSHGPE